MKHTSIKWIFSWRVSSLKNQTLPFPPLPREHLLHVSIRSSILCFGANKSSGFTEEELNYHEISCLVSNHASLGGCWAEKPAQICSQEWWELNRVHRRRPRLLPPTHGTALQPQILGGVSQKQGQSSWYPQARSPAILTEFWKEKRKKSPKNPTLFPKM